MNTGKLTNLHKSTGTLRYGRGPGEFYKLIVETDPGIVCLYRSFIPKYIDFNTQRYGPHISVIRKETPPKLDLWEKYEGKEIEFLYSNIINFNENYCWLNTFSQQLENIRNELGLSILEKFIKPPEPFIKTFHMTLGNFK